jgi:hypothetical protein
MSQYYNISNTELLISQNLDRLVSPIGEFHWRGLNHLDKNHINNVNKFHSNEQGDATLHTGVLLKALVWKFHKTKCKVTLGIIHRLLYYFEIHTLNNRGMLGRNFVLKEFYDLFPDYGKNSDGETSAFKDDAGKHIRYREVSVDGKIYYQRYDISVDAVSHVIAGLYWCNKFIPEYSSRCINILRSIYDYYQTNNWIIKDDNHREVRYGNHHPKINPFSRTNKIILEAVLNNKHIFSFLDYIVFNFLPVYLRRKHVRTHYFNTFIASSQFLILNDLGFNIKRGVKNLHKETRGDSNLYIQAIYEKIVNKKDILLPENWYIAKGHPIGSKNTNFPTVLEKRVGYCLWEFSPFRKTYYRLGDEITGNHDFLLVYWLVK